MLPGFGLNDWAISQDVNTVSGRVCGGKAEGDLVCQPTTQQGCTCDSSRLLTSGQLTDLKPETTL